MAGMTDMIRRAMADHTMLPWRREIGASPPDTRALWRIASAVMLVMLFLQLMKFKIVFAYIRFKTEWYAMRGMDAALPWWHDLIITSHSLCRITARVALILRYACLIVSMMFTSVLTASAALLLSVHYIMGAGEVRKQSAANAQPFDMSLLSCRPTRQLFEHHW
jgi:hypothetical protein